MILIKGLVTLFVLLSLIALDRSVFGERRSGVLVAMSGFLFVFWGSVLALLASR